MAYVSKELKENVSPAIKAILKKYGLKGTLSIRHYSTLVLTISAGAIDFIGNCNETYHENKSYYNYDPNYNVGDSIQVNEFYIKEHFTGKAQKALSELLTVMNSGNHDNSDSQIDYFDVGWYININIGKWDKPYRYIK